MLAGERLVRFAYDRLKADGTFAGLVGNRLYRDRVPQSAPLPAALVSLVSSTDLSTRGATRVTESALFDLHVVGEGADFDTPVDIADRGDAVLQGLVGTSDGVTVVKIRRTQAVAYTEDEAGRLYAHVVMTYRSEAYAT